MKNTRLLGGVWFRAVTNVATQCSSGPEAAEATDPQKCLFHNVSCNRGGEIRCRLSDPSPQAKYSRPPAVELRSSETLSAQRVRTTPFRCWASAGVRGRQNQAFSWSGTLVSVSQHPWVLSLSLTLSTGETACLGDLAPTNLHGRDGLSGPQLKHNPVGRGSL